MSRYINSFDEETIIRVLIAYLQHSMSHRDIQREILETPAPINGGGFIAMDILHYYDIYGSKKGVLKNVSIEKELKESGGNYKLALQKIIHYKEVEILAEKNIKDKKYDFIGISTELVAQTNVRINQNVLRKLVLSYYNNECALCDIKTQELLVCSHIIPWSIDPLNRLNPENAICFCVLHDRLFDRGFIGFNDRYEVIVSNQVDYSVKSLVNQNEIKLPIKHPPNPSFLKYHIREIFRR